jgi:transglutaminase-like putative cysteine protease
MRLHIRHETAYRYTAPAYYTIQQLRLTPRPDPHQRVIAWHIDAPGRLQRSVDAFGNIIHTMVVTSVHDAISVTVTGTVEVHPLSASESAEQSALSPLVFAVSTPLTQPDSAVRDFTGRHLRHTQRAEDFLALTEAICASVSYQSGVTEVTSTAAQALQIGRGVCQDHAHLFIACCRAAGVPARYVSGYVDPGGDTPAASHAGPTCGSMLRGG